MYCTKCGTKIDDNAAFCHNCGVSVSRETQYTDATEGQATSATAENTADAEFVGEETAYQFIDNDVVELIGEKNQDFYIARFAEMKQGNKKATWNWCAFLVTPLWLLHRKMYLYGIIYTVVCMVIPELPAVIDLLISVLMGVFGNYIYMMHLEKLAVEAKALQEPAKTQFVEKNKGTSWSAVGLYFLAICVLSFVGSFVFGVNF